MIVIDTFQRNFIGNENSAEDVGNFINKLDGLISHYKCCICLVHHTGHGNSNRGRGSSVMGASLDYEFKVNRKDEHIIGFVDEQMLVSFEQTLNKDGQGMAVKNFIFKEVDIIGEGLNLTSGFLEETDVQIQDKKGLSYAQQLVLDALEREAIFKNKEHPQDVYLMPADLTGKVVDSDGNTKTPESIKKMLTKLKDLGEVIYDEKAGYQSKEFSKLAPKFDD